MKITNILLTFSILLVLFYGRVVMATSFVWYRDKVSSSAAQCDFPGNDIKSQTLNSDMACISSCANTPGCSSYVWFSDSKTCFLKSGNNLAENAQPSKSSSRCGIMLNPLTAATTSQFTWGTDALSTTAYQCNFPDPTGACPAVNSLYECIQNCFAVSTCTNFAFFNGTCDSACMGVNRPPPQFSCCRKGGNQPLTAALNWTSSLSACGKMSRPAWIVDRKTYNVTYQAQCDFPGQDISCAASSSPWSCIKTCQNTPACTHYIWYSANGGTCCTKFGNVTKLNSYKYPNFLPMTDYISQCGIMLYPNKVGITWTTDTRSTYASQCDFPGYDIRGQVTSSALGCAEACSRTIGCTGYVWSSSIRGPFCLLKQGKLITQSNAVPSSTPDMVCGVMLNPYTTLGPWTQGDIGLVTYGCDFPVNQIGQCTTSSTMGASDCASKCKEQLNCFAFTWSAANGGTCCLKQPSPSGTLSTAHAGVYTQFDSVCGLNAAPNTNLPWTSDSLGSYAVGCDLPGNDIASLSTSSNSDCIKACSSQSGCSHFTWSNGICILKQGQVTQSSFLILIGSTCGILASTKDSSSCPYAPTSITCDPKQKYRSFDGTCNNLQNPYWGAANTPYERFLAPKYDDGTDTSRKASSVSGKILPEPRDISNIIFSQKLYNEYGWQYAIAPFGQLLAHDVTNAASSMDFTQCSCGDSTNPNCENMNISQGDTDMPNQSCIRFARNAPTYWTSSCTKTTYREQINNQTSYMDLSNIYGTSKTESDSLRTKSGGQLRTSPGLSANRTYLPKSPTKQCSRDANETLKCFLNGDVHVNSNLHLLSVNTLFSRNHNRLAAGLNLVNPQWDDETLFQEARRLNIAMYQHSMFSQWVQSVVGKSSPLRTYINFGIVAPGAKGTSRDEITGYNQPNFIYPADNLPQNPYFTNPTGHSNVYDPTINAQIRNEFAAAALRYGHSTVRDQTNLSDANGNVWMKQDGVTPISINLTEHNYLVAKAYDPSNNGIEASILAMVNLRGFTRSYGHLGKTGLQMSDTLRNNLFASPNFDPQNKIDLAATNVKRGRDHGIPSFNDFRQLCGWPRANSFSDLMDMMPNATVALLQSVYADVNDVDLWVGGLADNRRYGEGITGAVFSCLLERQMSFLRNGDRFWYSHAPDSKLGTQNTAFTAAQLTSIQLMTFPKLICNNFDTNVVAPQIMNDPWSEDYDFTPALRNCSTYPDVDLSLWKV